MCTCGHKMATWKEIKWDRFDKLFCGHHKLSQLLINHRIQQTMPLFMSQCGEQRALFHNLFEWLLKQNVFLIMENIHAIGPKKLPIENLPHLKMAHSITSSWSMCFPILWDGKSDLHFFGISSLLLDGQIILLPTLQKNTGANGIHSMFDTKSADLYAPGSTLLPSRGPFLLYSREVNLAIKGIHLSPTLVIFYISSLSPYPLYLLEWIDLVLFWCLQTH